MMKNCRYFKLLQLRRRIYLVSSLRDTFTVLEIQRSNFVSSENIFTTSSVRESKSNFILKNSSICKNITKRFLSHHGFEN